MENCLAAGSSYVVLGMPLGGLKLLATNMTALFKDLKPTKKDVLVLSRTWCETGADVGSGTQDHPADH